MFLFYTKRLFRQYRNYGIFLLGRIGTDLKGSACKIICSIKDEGIGISEEDLPNIFDKFYKSKLRQNAKGTGLGLPIAKQIALKHGGTIDVKSKPGEGTEFIFTFDEIFEEDL